MDFTFRGGRGFFQREFTQIVKLADLFGTEVVRQIHIAIADQALGDAQVLALVAVQHGNLAEVKRVEKV